MTQPGNGGNLSDGGGSYGSGVGEGRERGARRRRLAGYLKAANELRQSYQQSYAPGWGQRELEDEGFQDTPGAYPDVAVVSSGGEEMMLFPSYARRHVKKQKSNQPPPPPGLETDAGREGREGTDAGDAEFWRKEWEKHEDDNAIVDVDVRGWIYSPHRGPLNRKNRLMIGIARRLSGIPAPSGESEVSAGDSSRIGTTHQERVEARNAKREAEIVNKEAESIRRRGEGEADIADRGGYSEHINYDSDRASVNSLDTYSGSTTPNRRESASEQGNQPPNNPSVESIKDGTFEPGTLHKRTSWNQPSDMTPAELATANSHMMARLRPFLNNAIANTPITVFFYNDNTSQSRTTITNEAGHFNVRAALDFVPDHVRVLASDKLSATEEVRITEPAGISLISDIDDTIKHSGIGGNTREIFRNVFIRDLNDLAIDGVKDWYNKMADLGVRMHYVSNSPWQLYPVLTSFFSLAGLPPGSFHLKQYSGMLQGIFEPVAERKKGTLERIMNDFPERKFLLVGDSGEADLEVYTDIVVANPGRIVGVFIRDITTPIDQGFFDPSMGPLNGKRASKSDPPGKTQITRRVEEPTEERPALPTRNSTTAMRKPQPTGPAMGALIDIGDDPPIRPSISQTQSSNNSSFDRHGRIPASSSSASLSKSPPPARPRKPQALRNSASSPHISPTNTTFESPSPTSKQPPPLPPKSRRLSSAGQTKPPAQHPLAQRQDASSIDEQQDGSRRSLLRQKATAAYNSLPSASAYWYGPSSETSQPSPAAHEARSRSADSKPPAPPPRRTITSYPAAAAQYATTKLPAGWGGTVDAADDPNGYAAQAANKKEELWKRRWARAKNILDGQKVELRAWRVGGDVMDEAVRLVEKTLHRIKSRESTR